MAVLLAQVGSLCVMEFSLPTCELSWHLRVSFFFFSISSSHRVRGNWWCTEDNKRNNKWYLENRFLMEAPESKCDPRWHCLLSDFIFIDLSYGTKGAFLRMGDSCILSIVRGNTYKHQCAQERDEQKPDCTRRREVRSEPQLMHVRTGVSVFVCCSVCRRWVNKP